MRSFFAVLLIIFFVSASLVSLVTVVQGQTPIGVAGEEFTRPMLKETGEEWPTFSGVGHSLRYPPTWQAQPYQAQGGLRNSALFQFVWTDSQGLAAQLEALEIVNASDGTAAMSTELAYWQQTTQRAYQVEAVTVQEHPGWWIHAAQPLDRVGVAGVLWANWGERVYRFRLTCRPDACLESEQQLRQMLSTLQVITVDWQRAPEPLLSSNSQTVPAEAMIVPNSPTVVIYNRNAAYTYASTYWNQKANDDGHYLTSGAYDADGAHFVNRAVRAGGRPIPALWDAAAINVIGLRNWLQGDGWTTTPAAQAAVGDVAIMGPFSNPCWVGLVVVTGTNPTLATHSAELWASANSMYCNDSGTPTYVKTYLHANTEVVTSHVYLPLIAKPTPPPPIKTKTGMHLGVRSDDWRPPGSPADFLRRVDGNMTGGIWPAVVVVMSDQVYSLDRRPESPCKIAQARVRVPKLHDYLTEAQRNGVKILIRLHPSPGNFQDALNVSPPHELITQPGVTPENNRDYCTDPIPGDKKETAAAYYRAIDDLAEEMNEIYKLNIQKGWDPASFFFIPINEPNREWYAEWYNGDADIKVNQPTAWIDMENYFVALYDYVHSHYPGVRVLTPPMSQGNFAERWRMVTEPGGKCVSMTLTAEGLSGYDYMPNVYGSKNDGYAWNNYWFKGFETWEDTINECARNHHVFQLFPDWFQTAVQSSGKPAFIAEADLLSPCQAYNNPIQSKQDQPSETQESLRNFIAQEQGADYVAAWLLTESPYSSLPRGCYTTYPDPQETKWHQAYREDGGERNWFWPFWSQADH